MVDEDEFLRNIELLKKKSASPRVGMRKGRGNKSPTASPVIGSDDSNNNNSSKKKAKEGRKWDGKISAKDAKSLDYSNSDAPEVFNADHLVSALLQGWMVYGRKTAGKENVESELIERENGMK